MTAQRTPLAVVGVSALFPGSTDTEGFWRDILTGADRITDVPEAQWLIDDYYDPDPSAPDKTYAHRGGFLGEIDFDPLEWGTPPSLLEATDTAQLLALIVAQRVLDDATRGQFREMDRGRVSVILGVTSAQELLLDMTSRLQRPIWLESLRQAGVEEGKAQEVCQRIADHYVPWQEATFPGLLGNVIAGRIANRLDLGGTNCVTDAACASALSAVAMAAGELRMGSSDLVIVGGADTMTDIFMYMCFSKTPALSKSGDCRPFDQGADGTLLGEGIGMVALKRLADAERDGDPIYAVIKGIGASSDGRAKSVYAPSSEGQARALRRAYEEAGYAPEMVGLIEAHGTGTKAGDAAEIEGLLRVFGAAPPASIALGSVKSQIGHTKAAAGAAGLFKIVMALHSKTLPPTIKVTRPAEALIDGPLYVNTQARPWISAAPRRASVSALGFGGSNFHVTAEAYTGRHRAPRWRALPSELILVTAPDRAGLITRAEALLDAPGSLSHLAEQSQRGYTPQGARLAIIAHDRAALRERLGAALSRIKAGADHIDLPGRAHYGEGAREGGVAFLFPGQGSQYVNMGGALAMHYDQAMAAWEAAAAAGCCDASLHSVVFPPPAFDEAEIAAQTQRLKGTEWAQPAIGCVSLSMLNLLSDMGLRPDATGGHSFGEVTALYAAGAFDAATFLKIARRRGELMAEAAINPGAMTAVAAPAARLRARLAEWGSPVVLANDNAPTQAVLSGRVEDIEAVEARLQSVGISARRLSVDTAFHSEIVSGAAAPFAAFLDGLTISPPRCPVYANATAAPYAGTPEAIRAGLVDQIVAPVRFVSEIEAMHAAGIRVFVEIGPGAVLAGLTAAILKGRPHHAIATDRKGREGSVSWHDALGHLVALGFELDFAALWADQRPTAAPKPRAKMAVALTGANHRKPYPPKGGKAALTPPNLSAPTPILTPPTPIPQPTTPKLSAPTPIPQPTTPKLSAPTPIPQPTTPATPAQPHAASPLMAVQPSKPREITPMSPLRPDDAWLAAYQETQRQTASAHAAYQQAMAQSHAAFLRLAETSLVGLTALIQGQPLPRGSFAQVAPPAPAPMPPQAPVFEPVLATMPAPMPAPVLAPIPAPISAPMAPPAPVLAPIPAPMAPPAPNPAPMAPPAPVSAPVLAPVLAPIPAANDLVGLLLEVVADKTGYPAEMLSLEMTLEGDLGIDSIKRVEILSALQERDPRLPQLDTQTLAQQ
ncbi:acyltransferase domain-containing protein, partial [Myxococcota bacterium]|nr:acyltransferase domain-containing protein [Myxococcota bacterium]